MQTIATIVVQPTKKTHTDEELGNILKQIEDNYHSKVTTVVVMPEDCHNNHLAVIIRSIEKYSVSMTKCVYLQKMYIMTILPQ